MRHASARFRHSLRKMISLPGLAYSAQEMHLKPHPSMEKGVKEVDGVFSHCFT